MMQHELMATSDPSGLDARWKALAARDSAADGTGAWNELEPSVLAAMIAGARVDTAASVDSP